MNTYSSKNFFSPLRLIKSVTFIVRVFIDLPILRENLNGCCKRSGSGSYKDLPTGHKMDTIDVSNQLFILLNFLGIGFPNKLKLSPGSDYELHKYTNFTNISN